MERNILDPNLKRIFCTLTNKAGDHFVIAYTGKYSVKTINFWHITPEHTFLYTFRRNDIYNHKSNWDEDLLGGLLTDLHLQNPGVNVLRYVVDDHVILCNPRYAPAPKVPISPETPEWNLHLARTAKKGNRLARAEIEKLKTIEPAPFILYGLHDGYKKELAWRLTPDKPKRQNILPGDRVLVWTKYGFCKVTVTRIVEAGGLEQPTCRVKKKIH